MIYHFQSDDMATAWAHARDILRTDLHDDLRALEHVDRVVENWDAAGTGIFPHLATIMFLGYHTWPNRHWAWDDHVVPQLHTELERLRIRISGDQPPDRNHMKTDG